MSEQCKICGFEFRENSMVNGKCDLCNKKYADANSLEDLKKKPNDKEELKFANKIRYEVMLILEELGILNECECGNLFYKRSPAHKNCGKCGDK